VFPQRGRNVGGLETAAWLTARGLARNPRIDCSLVIRAEQALADEQIDGVHLVVDVDPRESVRRAVSKALEAGWAGVLRRWQSSLLWQFPYLAATWPWRRRDPEPRQADPRLLAIQSDVWIAMGASRESAGVIATAKAQHRPSVLMIQSNADLDPRYLQDPTFRNRYGEQSQNCLFAIEQADLIVCQTHHQLRRLRETFGREGELIRNAIDLEHWSPRSPDQGQGVLWIGRYDDFHKRPHLAIEIARRCGEIPFHMIINPSDPELERRLRENCPRNVRITPYVPADRMPETMAGCQIFLSTGAAQYEGFPNVLLQATAAGKPIVSLDDFDDYLARSGAGIVCGGDLAAATHAITQFHGGQLTWDPRPARQYLLEHHALDTVINRLLDQLHRLC